VAEARRWRCCGAEVFCASSGGDVTLQMSRCVTPAGERMVRASVVAGGDGDGGGGLEEGDLQGLEKRT
jgi:hypothetical protein